MEVCEEAIEFVNGNHFAYAGVVIEDRMAIDVSLRIVIAQGDFRAADELGVAKDDPGLILPRDKAVPEDA